MSASLRKDEKPRPEVDVPEHVHTHPVFSGGSFGIMSPENPRFPAKHEGTHALEDQLKHAGLRYERTVGQYDSPETSYIVHNPTLEQMQRLGKDFGQESIIHSQGGQHKLVYTNGPSEGHFVGHHAEAPHSYFSERPDNFWTAMPGDTGFFRLNLDPEWKLQPPAALAASAHNLQTRDPSGSTARKSETMATKRSMQDLKKALADRLKKAEAEFAELGRREAKLVKTEPVDPHQARAEATLTKMSEQDKQVLANRYGYTSRWHRELKKSDAGDGHGPDYRKARDGALKKHFAKSYEASAGLDKHGSILDADDGHMEPGVHENPVPGMEGHAEPGGHEMAAMPLPDAQPEQPISSSVGLPVAELEAPAQTMPAPSALDPQAGLGAERAPQVGAGADLCPLCGHPDQPGSCQCLQAQQAAPMAMSEVKKNFLDEGGDGADEPSCPMCHGPGKIIGQLGSKEHFMCQNCGVGFHREAAPEPEQPMEAAPPVQKAAGDGSGMGSGPPGADMGSGPGYNAAASPSGLAMSEPTKKNALSGYGPMSPAGGPGQAGAGASGSTAGLMRSDKEPTHQPVASPTEMACSELVSSMSKAAMCKACGQSHEMGKCMKTEMAKATDFVDVNGKHATKGLAPRAKLPPASPENQGPGLSGPASKEMSAAGSGGEKKPTKKAEPPMAKPPSGKNPGTMVPTAKPAGAMKAEDLSKPPVSEAQRRAMGAAAGGNSTLGIPKKVGKEFIDADKGGKLPETKKAAEPMDKAGLPMAPKPGPSMGAKMMGGGATGLTSPNDMSRANTHAAAMGGAFQPKGPISSGLELAPKKPAGMQAPTAAMRTPGGTGQAPTMGGAPKAPAAVGGAPKPAMAAPKAPGLTRSQPGQDDLKKADLGNCVLCNHPEHAGPCEQ